MKDKLSKRKKREYLINIIKSQLKVSIEVSNYHRCIAPNKKLKRMFSKNIEQCENAIKRLDSIKHLDLIEYLYNAIIGDDPNKVSYFLTCPLLVNSEKIKEWDTKEKHQDFVDFIEQQRKEQEEIEKTREENTLAVKKAKEMGKKVELVYNPKTKKVEPKIFEENPNA